VSEGFVERRRSPRVKLPGALAFRAGRRVRVRVLDISGTGALLASDDPLPVGLAGRLPLSLGGAPFEAQVRVVRDQPAGHLRQHAFGVTVVPTEPRYQEVLDGFLRRAGN